MNKYVFVTGGAGYIGSHACKSLSSVGYVPVTIDNLSTGWSKAVKFGPLENIDLLDRAALEIVFQKYQPISVLHFAALSQVPESVVSPQKYWRNNFVGSLNLFEACAYSECKNIILSSTCATYGDHDNIILNEDSEQRPVNPYGASKRAVEELLQHMSIANGLKYVIFRYFNVAGADPDGEIGEFHFPETHLIPIILDAVAGKRDAITIFGDDYDTPDGTCIRDYVHVCDLIDAHILGLNWLEAGGSSRVFNLGTGKGFSVQEVVQQVSAITNSEVPLMIGDRRAGDCAKLVSGSELARDLLGWEPKISSLTHMISDAWKWHQSGGYEK